MTTLLHMDLDLDPAAFLEQQGEAVRHPRAAETAARALADARALVDPRLVYEWLPCEVLEEHRVKVGGAVFHLGRHADLLEQAVEAFVGVVTIGPALERRARELAAESSTFDSYMLGEAGVFAVGLLLERAHQLVEEQARERGWGVGPELAPGQLAGWGVGEQRVLTALLDVAAVGVSVTEAGMLVPQKSASLVVGAGPGYPSAAVRSPCEFCAQGETCRWRH